MGGARPSPCHCLGSSNYRCAECRVCGEEGGPEGKAVVLKGKPTFNVQKVPCEQELDSAARTLGLHPLHKKGAEVLGCCPGSPGFGQVADGVFSVRLQIRGVCRQVGGHVGGL